MLLQVTQVMDDRWAEQPAAGDCGSVEIQQGIRFSQWSCERRYDGKVLSEADAQTSTRGRV